MRQRGNGSSGRGRAVLVVAVSAAILVAGGVWPSAEATASRASVLDAVLRAEVGEYRKSMAIEELRLIDSSESREKLLDLADSSDPRLAILALRALGRSRGSSATAKIEDVYEDSARSDLVRSAALAVWCQNQKQDEASWADCRSWVRSHAGSNQRLQDQYAALKTKLWSGEAD